MDTSSIPGLKVSPRELVEAADKLMLLAAQDDPGADGSRLISALFHTTQSLRAALAIQRQYGDLKNDYLHAIKRINELTINCEAAERELKQVKTELRGAEAKLRRLQDKRRG